MLSSRRVLISFRLNIDIMASLYALDNCGVGKWVTYLHNSLMYSLILSIIMFLAKVLPFTGSNVILGPKSYLKQYSIILTNRAVPNLAILLL